LITVEGFIEAKIERFGQALVNKVIEVSQQFTDITKSDDANTCESR